MENEYNDKEFENLFRKSFEDFEDFPAPDAWEKISGEISQKPTSFWKRFWPFLLLLPFCIRLIQGTTNGESVNHLKPSENQHLLSSRTEKTVRLSKTEKRLGKSKTTKNTNSITDKPTPKKQKSRESIAEAKQTPKVLPDSKKQNAINKHKVKVPILVKKEDNEKAKGNSKEELIQYEQFVNSVLANQTISVEKPAKNRLPLATDEHEESAVEKKNKGHWFFQLSPLYTASRVAANSSDEWLIDENQESKGLNAQNIGLSFGMGWEKQLTPRLLLDASLNYSILRKKLTFNYKSLQSPTFQTSFDSAGMLFLNPQFEERKVDGRATYQLVSSRIGLNYQPFPNKPKQWVTLGLGVDALFDLQTKPSDLLRLEEQKSLHPVAYLGYEWRTKLGNGTLGISPNVNYYFSSLLSEQSSISNKPYTMGLRLRFTLGRNGNRFFE